MRSFLSLFLIPILLVMIAELGIPYTFELGLNRSAQIDSKNLQVMFKNGLLTFSATEVELEAALHQISEKSNLEVRVKGSISGKVTLSFEKLTLEEGLRRLLRNQNYAFTYSEEKDTVSGQTHFVLSRVDILEKSTSVGPGKGDRLEFSEKFKEIASSQDPKSMEQIVELIQKLPIQDQPIQNVNLKSLMEEINPNVEQVRKRIMSALEQLRKKENENLSVWDIKTIFRGTDPDLFDSQITK